MNYTVNIKPKHLILAGIIISLLISKTEKDVKELIKTFKKEKCTFCGINESMCSMQSDDFENYIYCPCCGKKLKNANRKKYTFYNREENRKSN